LLLAPDYPLRPADLEISAELADAKEPLPVADSLAFLEKCQERYREHGPRTYRATLLKQERVGGELRPREEIEVAYRESPRSVYMHWRRGQNKADSLVYVEGQNNGEMLVKPAGVASFLVKVAARDPEGPEARQSGRYTVKQLGLKEALDRTVRDWKAARQQGALRVEYLGVRRLREASDRPCYTLRRICDRPLDDGYTEVTVYIDKETWFQIGTVLKGEGGKLIGEYIYRDLELNPELKANQFDRSALAS
jgi:hypothetical protein